MACADPVAADRPLRVLRVLTRPNLGGPTRQAIVLWHAHRQQDVSTLLVTGEVGPGEVALLPTEHGVPAVSSPEQGPGWLVLPDLVRGLDPLADRRARRALADAIRAFRPDVVHTHTSKAGLLGRQAARAERVPVVAHTFHGHVLKDYFGRLPSWLLARVERRLARRSDLLFAVSESCAEELAALRIAPRARFAVLPPAVATSVPRSRAEARREFGIEPREWRVAAVGRLVAVKRLAHFVEMVAGVPELAGDIVGDGPDRAELQALVDGRAAGRVRLRGADEHIAAYLTAYDAVVLPSVREGCPLIAIEAFAAGVPVVGYDVPGVRDALGELGNGVLVDEREGPAGLARAVRNLRRDRALADEVVRTARRALARCRPAEVAAALLSAYRAGWAAAQQPLP